MKGLDAIVFTGDIGRYSHGVRSLACQGLEYMGISIDEDANKAASSATVTAEITAPGSTIRVLVVPADELRMIARETLRTVEREKINRSVSSAEPAPIPVEVSAHHVHLSQEHVEALFGPGHKLTPDTELSQPGQFACKEKVMLVGPKGTVDRVRVLGPARKETQVEIAMTEQFKLGIYPPVRESGDIQNTPGLTLEGTEGRRVSIDKGVICAMRHIHMSPDNALKLGLQDRYIVRVRIESDRELIYGDVLVRVNPSFNLAMHIDTDEANAANLKTGAIGYIDGIQSRN
jgi:acetate kinase